MMQECFMRVLKGKTILYVTHQVEFLPAADLIWYVGKHNFDLFHPFNL